MILAEVFTLQGERVSHQVFRQDLVKFGRHSSNDLILADPRAPLYGGEIQVGVDLQDQKEILISPFRIHFVSLAWLNQLPDSDSIHVASPQTSAKGALPLTRPETYSGGLGRWSLPLWALFNLIYLLHFSMMTSEKHDWLNGLVEFLSLNGVLLIPTVVLSILSKAINHQYRFRALLNINISLAFVWSLVNLDLLGLRWLAGDWAVSKVFSDSLRILGVGLALYLISEVIFDHIRKPLRLGIFLVGGLIALFGLFQRYVPLRNQFQFIPEDKRPLLYPIFERTPISKQDLFMQIETQMNEQTKEADSLSLKINLDN